MKSKLFLLKHYSGSEASIYTVLEEVAGGKATTMFSRFINRLEADFYPELDDISHRLHVMGNETGCLHIFFKHDEGLEAYDMVCALFDQPDSHLRLFCVRFNSKITIIGDGGNKTTRTWQEDPLLTKTVGDMMHVSRIVRKKLENGDLTFSASGLSLEGDLYISRT